MSSTGVSPDARKLPKGPPRRRFSDEERAQVVDRVEELTPSGSQPTKPLFRRVGREFSVSEKSVARWCRDRRKRDRVPWRPSLEELVLAAEFEGSWEAIHGELCRLDPAFSFCVKTVERGYKAKLRPAVLAGLRSGYIGFRKRAIIVRNPDGRVYRNQIWEIDNVSLPYRAIVPHGRRPRTAWAVVVLDVGTRAIMGWVIVIGRRPNRSDVLQALGAAARHNPDRGPFHGKPDLLRCDNGLEFLAEDVFAAMVEAGSFIVPTLPWTPQHKGKIERFFSSFKRWMRWQVPGAINGRRDKTGRRYDADAAPLSSHELCTVVEATIDKYNNERRHSSLGRRTPCQAWNDDPTPIRAATDDELRWTFLCKGYGTVSRGAIKFDNRYFQALELDGCDGERVEFGYLQSDLRSIDVFRDGRYFCTADDTASRSPEYHRAVREIRDEQEDLFEKLLREVTSKQAARRRLAEAQHVEEKAIGVPALTSSDDHHDTPRTPPQKLIEEHRSHRTDNTRQKSQSDIWVNALRPSTSEKNGVGR